MLILLENFNFKENLAGENFQPAISQHVYLQSVVRTKFLVALIQGYPTTPLMSLSRKYSMRY